MVRRLVVIGWAHSRALPNAPRTRAVCPHPGCTDFLITTCPVFLIFNFLYFHRCCALSLLGGPCTASAIPNSTHELMTSSDLAFDCKLKDWINKKCFHLQGYCSPTSKPWDKVYKPNFETYFFFLPGVPLSDLIEPDFQENQGPEVSFPCWILLEKGFRTN